MAFLWKGDTLYTKRGIIPPEQVSELTTFYLTLRDPMEIPKSAEFGRFIVTSMAFTSNIRQVNVYVDDERIQYYDKKISEPRPLSFQNSEYMLTSPNSFFKLTEISIKNIQLDVSIKEEKINFLMNRNTTESECTVYMKIAVGKLQVTLPKNIEKDMERTTKKKPPMNTDIQIIFSNFDEYEGSISMVGTVGIFQDLLVVPGNQGKIFIGFPTHQTTGCSVHIAAHLIPTVERESIDFVDKVLGQWNQEILSMSGLLTRIVAEDDLDSISILYKEMQLDSTSEQWLQKKGIHNMASFSFQTSTPSPLVGRIISNYFYKMTKRPMRIVSNLGIFPAAAVRLKDRKMMEFLKKTPTIPDLAITKCPNLINQLTEMGWLKPQSIEDLFVEISLRSFNTKEIVAVFQWWIEQWRSKKITRDNILKLFNGLIHFDEDSKKQIPMTAIKYHAQAQLVPSDLPLPDSVLNISISKFFIKPEIEQAFWSISEYTILDWLQFIIKNELFGISPEFTEKVMTVFNRHFGSMSASDKVILTSQLGLITCITTRSGMKIPTDSYFKTVNLFKDLPVIHFSNSRGISDNFLRALGVREHVDLQMVFDRLLDLNWDITQLIKYLTTVKEKLTSSEISRLQSTAMFPYEQKSVLSETRVSANRIYSPTEILSSFGLPVLSWKGKWKSGSEEAKFMAMLGLNQYIPIDLLINMAARASQDERMRLILYFADNFKSAYATTYYPSQVTVPFIPTNNSLLLAKPLEIFVDERASVLGFVILDQSLKIHAEKLGVNIHPSSMLLLERLKANPPKMEDAVSVFLYLSSRLADFDKNSWQKIRSMEFIPVEKKSGLVWMSPSYVYFGKPESQNYGSNFTYIDFGNSCNAFLSACGVKDEPTPIELAELLVRSPVQSLENLGFEAYLGILRQIASHYSLLSKNSGLISQMKKSPFLVGIRTKSETSKLSTSNNQIDENSSSPSHYQLAKAQEIYLVDDTVLGQLFNPLGAPIETMLENMYQDLGSQWISSQVKEVVQPLGSSFESSRSRDLERLIHDRAALLLYDGQQLRSSNEILPKAQIFLKSLKCLEVQNIEISRTFGGITRKQNTTACLTADRNNKNFVLMISGDYDYFDVSSSMSRIIFKKTRLNDTLLLSTLLSTSLENLRRKGFPVDRILNLTQNLKSMEQIAPVNDVKTDTKSENAKILSSMFPNATKDDIEKVIDSSSNESDPLSSAANKLAEYTSHVSNSNSSLNSSKNADESNVFRMFSKWTDSVRKNLGINSNNPDGIQNQKLLSGIDSTQKKEPTAPNTQKRDITPSSTSAIKEQLQKSVSSLSNIRDSEFRATMPSDPVPAITTPQSTKNPCRILADSDLILLELISDIPFYIDKAFGSEMKNIFISNKPGLIRFSNLIKMLSKVFNCTISTIGIYWDQTGDSIAFNRNKSLFFNAKYYIGLHFVKCKNISNEENETYDSVKDEDPKTFYYWFMTFSHELAHNFVHAHDAEHEFWMSCFAEEYMSELIVAMKGKGII